MSLVDPSLFQIFGRTSLFDAFLPLFALGLLARLHQPGHGLSDLVKPLQRFLICLIFHGVASVRPQHRLHTRQGPLVQPGAFERLIQSFLQTAVAFPQLG